ncbi:MAG: TetR/AcrR family transcriptional regulator [Rhodobacteraceae bacterium]|nr:TetR/AcrR family transcriptional regulator [Paracoccaceae bacterium]
MTRKPQKLEQVIEAAIVEFQDNGFAAANMDRVSERAQVSKRTLYNYFDSKELLFQEIVNRAGEHFADNVPCKFVQGVEISLQLHDLALRLIRPYTNADAVKMARLITGEMLRNREMVAGMISEIELAKPADAFFSSAILAGAVTKQNGDALAEDFSAFIKGRCFWPAVLSGEVVSLAKAEHVAKSASRLFSSQI